MPWSELTEARLLDSMTHRERADFGRASSSEDPENPGDRVPGILADVIAEVRGYIQTCDRNQLSANRDLIPDSMMGQALALARWRVLATIPRYVPGETRQKEYESALRYFERVATCLIRPEPPADPVPNPTPPQHPHHSAEVIDPLPRRTGRRLLDGL